MTTLRGRAALLGSASTKGSDWRGRHQAEGCSNLAGRDRLAQGLVGPVLVEHPSPQEPQEPLVRSEVLAGRGALASDGQGGRHLVAARPPSGRWAKGRSGTGPLLPAPSDVRSWCRTLRWREAARCNWDRCWCSR